MRLNLFATTFVFLLCSCASKPVINADEIQACQEQMQKLPEKVLAQKKLSSLDRKYWQAIQNTPEGKKILAFQTDSTCEFNYFRKDPVSYCPGLNADSLNVCFETYVDGRLKNKRADSALLLLASATYVEWYMKFRKKELHEKPPAFWTEQMGDFTLYIAEKLPERTDYKELLGDEANSEIGKEILDYDRRVAQKAQQDYMKIVAKMLRNADEIRAKQPSFAPVAEKFRKRLKALRAGAARIR